MIVERTQSSTRQSYLATLFLPHSCVFALKLREITLKKIVKSILRCRKTEGNIFARMICTRHSRHNSRRGNNSNNNNNTHLFSLLSVNKFKSFLLNVCHKTHGYCFIVYFWVIDALGRRLGGLLSSQELEV